MAGQSTWSERHNGKLVEYMNRHATEVTLSADGEWVLEGRIGRKCVTIRQEKPKGAYLVNGEAVLTQDLVIDLLEKIAAKRTAPQKRRKTKRGYDGGDLHDRGIRAAARFLDRRGYQVVEREWECEHGTVELIALDEEWIVFVEVKTRSSCSRGLPAESVSQAKIEKYELLACEYLRQNDYVDRPIRFDIVSIVALADDRAMIRHHINAFSSFDDSCPEAGIAAENPCAPAGDMAMAV